jgi:hypothetical protein
MSSAAGPGFEFEGLHRSFSECEHQRPLAGFPILASLVLICANRSLFFGGTLGWFVPGD